MNKKLMALAVAGAFATPVAAFAQASSVQISGRMALGIDSYSAKGATLPNSDFKSRTRIYDGGSRLVIQGTEALGQGLTTYFYVETGFNADTGNNLGQSGGINTNTGYLGARGAWLGIRGNWGALQFGRPNVYYTNGTTHFSNLGASWAHAEPMLLTNLWGRGMGPGVAKQPNTLTYITPVLGGITTWIHYSANGNVFSSGQETQGANQNTDARLWAASMVGVWGAWAGGLDWVKGWSNTTVGGTQGTSNAWKGHVGYTYQSGGKIAALYMKSNQHDGGSSLGSSLGPPVAAGLLGLGTNLSQNGWAVEWSHTLGNVQGMLTWGKINNISGCTVGANCDNTNATTWQIAARYILSKRTWLTAHYDSTTNAANYNLDYTFSQFNAGPINFGADPRIVGMGVTHFF